MEKQVHISAYIEKQVHTSAYIIGIAHILTAAAFISALQEPDSVYKSLVVKIL